MMDRRTLLTAAIATPMAAIPVVAKPIMQESINLRELGDQLPELIKDVEVTRQHRKEIYLSAMKEWPDAPSELIANPPKGALGSHPLERSVNGAGMPSGNHVKEASGLRKSLEHNQMFLDLIERKSKSADRAAQVKLTMRDERRKLRLATKYEREIARITNTCGYEAATNAYTLATKALSAHIDKIMACDVVSMAGVTIKAKALHGWTKVDLFQQRCNISAPSWNTAMSSAVLSIA